MKATLNYHRRHGLNCEGGHPAGAYSSEPEERKKGYKRCKCPIYASGSLSREAKRFATKLCDWAEAADLMAPYIAANSWSPGGLATVACPRALTAMESDAGDGVPIAAPGRRALMADAVHAFNSEYANASWKTRKGVEYSTNELLAFAGEKGLRYVHEWTPALVRDLRASWVFQPRSKGQQRPLRAVMNSTAKKKLALAKRFFEFCLEGEWAIRNPAHIKPARGKRRRDVETVGRQRLPYSDAEIERMYEACQRYGVRDSPVPGRCHKWTGEDLRDFIAISIHTGMRISDVVTFHIDALRDNGEVRIRTIKSQGDTEVCSCVPEWLAQIMRNRARKFGPYIFGARPTEKIDGITDPWRERLNALWAQVGKSHPWKAKPEHHRFRHTFARILLQRGTPVPDVANLLGNTEEVVRKYYKAWVPELQARTTELLREAFANTPRPDQPRRVKVQAIG